MPRRPPKFDPLSPQSVRVTIVQRLVTPESLAGKGAWGRELHILKKLQETFRDEAFWLELAPAEQLESLSYFVAPFGAAQLREQWNLHVFGRAQEQISIDSQTSARMMDCGGLDDGVADLPVLKKKENAIAWCDSGSEGEDTAQQPPDVLASDIPASDSTGK